MSELMHDVTLITDSTCDIPNELLERYGIITVPLYVLWGAEQLRDGVDLDRDTFYARLPRDPIHPKTSQPTPADFAQTIRACGAREALIITISGQLSGTLASANGARELVDVPVHTLDSYSTSMGLGWQVLAAARARENGGDLPAMIAAAQDVRSRLSTLFTVDTLDYLYRGGRIGGATRFLGTALQLKPLLQVDSVSGRVDAVERIRSRKRALQRVIEATFERVSAARPLHVAVIHAGADEDAQLLHDQVLEQYQPQELIISCMGPVLGIHGGPGLAGMAVYSD